MARRIYSAITSADGYVEDADGSFDWGAPDEELLRFGREDHVLHTRGAPEEVNPSSHGAMIVIRGSRVQAAPSQGCSHARKPRSPRR
jgi:hypothetical protein